MRSFIASALVHVAAIALLFCVHVSIPARQLDRRPVQLTLLAPTLPRRVSRPRPLPPSRHRFAPTLRTAPVLPVQEIPAAPALVPHPSPVPEIPAPTVADTPAPPASIRTGVFNPPADSTTFHAALPIPVRTAGFGTADFAQAPSHSAPAGASGFDSGAPGLSAAPRRPLAQAANFGDASVATPRGSMPSAAAASTTPVEILDKPRPAYTDEARRAALEGEVLLQVQFEASGHVQILRVIRGLGRGLDESAIVAAQSIRFRPALRDGSPVDSTAQVHIVFQLAY